MVKWLLYFLLVFESLTLINCAKRGTLTGGLKDTIPPVLLNADPPLNNLNFNSEKITLNFNEYIELKEINEQLIISPPLEVKDYKINDLKQNEIFSEDVLKRIFQQKDGEINLITNNTLSKSFLVMSIKTKYRDLKKGSNEYEKYEAKARLNLVNKIYQSHDNNLNEKYKVEFNQRTIERVKNSF